jgi:hypothetical protein
MTTSTSRIPSTTDKPPVVFLLAVWGESYIKQFFGLSLRSLLAPGNIPAMAENYDCTFIFLTNQQAYPIFKRQPLLKLLEQYCHVEFVEISDMIFGDNYSATITLAYERGMRSRGAAICDTYFVYLVADYVMADDSLRNLQRYMREGYSGITAGNFQVIEEEFALQIKRLIDNDSGAISISARELVALAFDFLHPMTLANTVSQSLTHASHSNRLFWRLDDNTLIGRFYLRHMLCIKPEISNYIIGSSCDYSFIVEMCPSGKVAHITDSDEYCVVELQPYNHENNFVRYGPLRLPELAESLSDWTTVVHRGNAYIPVVYHCADAPETLPAMIAESERFVETIEKMLVPQPQPVRGHYYWTSCIEGITYNILHRHNKGDYFRRGVFAGVIGSPVFGPVFDSVSVDHFLMHIRMDPRALSSKKRWFNTLVNALIGIPPNVRMWHRQWLDFRYMHLYLRQKFVRNAASVLISTGSTYLVGWLDRYYPGQCMFQQHDLFMMRSPEELKEMFIGRQNVIFLFTHDNFHMLYTLVLRCTELMDEGARLLIFFNYDGQFSPHVHLRSWAAGYVAPLLGSRLVMEDMHFNNNILRRILDPHYRKLQHKLLAAGALLPMRLIALAGLGVLGVFYLLSNLLSLIDLFPQRQATSAVITLRIQKSHGQDERSAIRRLIDSKGKSRNYTARHNDQPGVA